VVLLKRNPPTRSGKPSDLVAAGLGVQNATLIDLLPGANLGKDVVAGGVQAVFNNPPLVRIVVGAATANQSQIIEDATNIATDGINLAADGITLAAVRTMQHPYPTNLSIQSFHPPTYHKTQASILN